MNNLTFFLDDYPQNLLNPREVMDHNAKLVTSFMYQPIFLREKGQIIPNGIIDESVNGKIRIKFGKSLWSDGSRVTANDFYNSLRYILVNNPLSSYLNFIKGVSEYVKGNVSLDDIKMKVEGDYFCAEVYRSDLYKGVFSNINFSPKKFENGELDRSITAGVYKLIKQYKNKIVLIRNQNLINLPEYVYFRIEKDFLKQLKRVNEEKYSYTGFTSTNFSQIGEINTFPINSGIHFRIIISSEVLNIINLSKFRYEIKEEIRKNIELKKLIELSDDTLNLVPIDGKQLRKREQTVNFLYPNYYPNDILVRLTSKILKRVGCGVTEKSVSLSKFMTVDIQDYDMILELVEPITDNRLDKWIEQIRFIEQCKKSDYVSLINEYLEPNNFYQDIESRIEAIIFSNSLCVDIGLFKQYYTKSEGAPQLILTDDGLIKIISTVENSEIRER